MEENFLPQFKETFEKFDWPNNQLFLCRSDGVILYQSTQMSNNLDAHSIGALIGGVWQAAKSLSGFIPGAAPSKDGYRLSFDTSSQGVYILPFSLGTEEYYLGSIYKDEENPGKIKSMLRSKIFALEKKISEKTDTKQGDKKEQYLFKNISDQEMDDIFGIYS